MQKNKCLRLVSLIIFRRKTLNEDGEQIWVNVAHSHSMQGYIDEVYDSTREGGKGHAIIVPAGTDIDSGHFSAVHDETETGKIFELTTTGSMDNHTKLIAEGARFQCVRENIEQIENDSYFIFHGTAPDNNGYYTVPFFKLWNKWGDFFSKKYDLSDQDILVRYKALREKKTANAVGTVAVTPFITYYPNETMIPTGEKYIRRNAP